MLSIRDTERKDIDMNTKNIAFTAIAYFGGCVLLAACLFGITIGKVDLLDGLGFAACLSIAITVAGMDLNEQVKEMRQ